ncbi:MAG: P-loop NTPase [Lachnospiraceae bacterium]|nr:P-loop NTPase [Lachnospiraceae bacterium]
MSEELRYEQEGSCSGNCSGCGSDCSSRKPDKSSFLEPMNEYSNVKRVIGVVSGKGGVGKSFVTSYLSVLMNRKGFKTAILDADITGPSIPKAFGMKEMVQANEMGIIPAVTKNGIEMVSVNLLLDAEDTPVIWRGPVIAGTVKQFWSQVLWGDVDYMFVDMPPGTGDVPLTVFQSLPLDGIIIVTSPQELVSMIVSKAVNMAKMMDIPVLGLVENYSYIQCGNCGEKISVFGKSHIDEISEKFGIPVLAKLPLDSKIAEAIDAGLVEDLQGDWMDAAANVLESITAADKAAADKAASKNVKIAVTTDENKNVYGHFGSATLFTVYTLEEGRLVEKKELANAGNGHTSTVEALVKENVNVVICGGIGGPAMDGLLKKGILVIPGVQGDIDVAVAGYLDGSLNANNVPTCNHHDHEDGECTCGEHEEGGCHCGGGCCH